MTIINRIVFDARNKQIRKTCTELEHLAYHDPMTGVGNRRRLNELLSQWSYESTRGGKDFALLFIDIKDFKLVNDTYGHEVGDAVLMNVANTLEASVGKNDEVCRYAGDEFVVLSRTSDELSLIDALCCATQNVDWTTIAPNLSVSIDIGGCRYSEAGGIQPLIAMADQRMYECKRACIPSPPRASAHA